MERLTERFDGWVMRKGCHGPCKTCTEAECADIYPMIDRLAAYEDTGLGPDEITTEPYGCVFYCNRKCNLDGDFCAEWPGCPYEIGAATAKHMLDLAQAERDGRLVVLPCKDGAVYTIEEDYFNCAECKNGSGAHYQAKIGRVSCDMDNGERCPFYIKEHEVEGFEISFDATGKAVLSSPGNFGYEGLEQFSGVDGKVYYTREEAEAELKKREQLWGTF